MYQLLDIDFQVVPRTWCGAPESTEFWPVRLDTFSLFLSAEREKREKAKKRRAKSEEIHLNIRVYRY